MNEPIYQKSNRRRGKNLWSIIKIILWAILLAFLVEKLGFGYGLAGFVLLILIIVMIGLWKARQSFMTNLRGLETVMYGKPLDKELWKKGEKVKMRKFKWKKN
jgi:hypothetical protein